MSVPTGGINAALTAAAAAKRLQQEEEEMTTYSDHDLNGWEFKIVRSAFGRFSNYQAVQKICQEEAETGWELVEKFDQYRIRFKRRVERRSNDHLARLDPYRTSPGFSRSSATTALVIGVLLLVVAGAALLLIANKNEWDTANLPIPIILILLVAVPVFIVVMRRRGR
jgi:hypothetical protein